MDSAADSGQRIVGSQVRYGILLTRTDGQIHGRLLARGSSTGHHDAGAIVFSPPGPALHDALDRGRRPARRLLPRLEGDKDACSTWCGAYQSVRSPHGWADGDYSSAPTPCRLSAVSLFELTTSDPPIHRVSPPP